MRLLKSLIILALAGGLGYLAFAFIWGFPSVEQRPITTDQATIDRGEYLTALGDCTSCHTAEDGASFAGGRFLETPFGGGLYSANITPSSQGIAGMTSAEFYQVLAFGADTVWRPIYPAMPYTSYHVVTRDDSDAIFAYLMSLDPVHAEVPANTLPFPYNIRLSLFGWNLLFADRSAFSPDPKRSDSWNRGAYLVTGLGHCGECHTPRNALGAMEPLERLIGAKLTGFEAPDITANGLTERGWTHKNLVTYFATGTGPQGTTFGEMHLAIKNSLSKANPEDQSAMASYLLNLDAAPSDVQETVEQETPPAFKAYDASAGRSLYLSNCSLCHGRDGRGVPSVMPALAGNSTVAQNDAVNLVLVVAWGLDASTDYGPMPSFADRLSDTEISDLVNYLRQSFSNLDLPLLQAADVRGTLNQN
ncbi:cytochrome c [uncultured Ruegeria sp.]|uniref:c-type cytochrome n=1 Tax=uncultured Ruegeria sp. TaxID=259304 RepID=UPI00262D8A3A|nr:cytochrome c [uncultured Ruegeria sp.]